jgi:signal transduction histidine kinase
MTIRLAGMATLAWPAAAFAADTAWNEPLLRAISSDYRQALIAQERLREELATLPETPHNQQSSRLGYQIHRVSTNPMTTPAWVEVELPEETEIDAVVLVPINAPSRDFPGPGYGFPQRFRVEIIGEEADHVITEHGAQAFPNPGGLPVWLPAQGIRGRRVRLTMTEPWTRVAPFAVYALGEIMVMRGNRNLAAGAPAASSEPLESLTVWGRPDFLTDSQSLLGAPLTPERSRTMGYHSAIVSSPDVVKWVQVDLGAPMRIDEVRMIGGNVVQFPNRPGFGFPVRFKIEAAEEPTFSRPTLLVDQTAQDFANPANNPVTFPVHHITARYVRVTATKLWERVENFAFALAELQIYSGDQNVALGRPVDCLDRYPSTTKTWMPEHLTDGFASEQRLTEWPGWLRGLSRRREALLELAAADRQAAGSRAKAGQRLTNAVWFTGLLGVVGLVVVLQRARRERERALDRLRQSIASDLHDEIGSNLGSIALLSELSLSRDGGMARGDLEEVRRVARQTADSMRDIVGLIHRPAATGEDFVTQLREIAGRMLGGLDWTFHVSPTLDLPPLAAQRHLLLAFKEALHNLRKHAAARHVTIDLTQDDTRLTLSITDDGIGFDPAKSSDGHGLASLRHRAAALGGELTVRSAPNAGTTLVFSANLRPARLR